MRFLAILTALVAAAASFAAVVLIRSVGSSAPQAKAPVLPRATSVALQLNPPNAARKNVSLGIISYNLPIFEQKTKIFPAITAKYFSWGDPFPTAQILANHASGTETLIVLEPQKQNLRKLASGKFDPYLKKWAAAEKALGLPIILSFAPEANGDWYPWGKGHVSAALYKKLFRHVHNVVLKAGAKHITWLWQVDRSSKNTEALSAIWPGRSYVNVIGLDGQLGSRTATFNSVFGATYSQIRKFTRVPVMLSEVGIKTSANRPKQLTALFASAHKAPLAALVFFDVGVWNFDADKATLKALRAAAAPKK
ncbi:MAG TPA: glycosyl hydrolase [Streptosporangiaceae bacterium]|nr:glycosyl hydrolase [Streptosporangiaceae bacterium]